MNHTTNATKNFHLEINFRLQIAPQIEKLRRKLHKCRKNRTYNLAFFAKPTDTQNDTLNWSSVVSTTAGNRNKTKDARATEIGTTEKLTSKWSPIFSSISPQTGAKLQKYGHVYNQPPGFVEVASQKRTASTLTQNLATKQLLHNTHAPKVRLRGTLLNKTQPTR